MRRLYTLLVCLAAPVAFVVLLWRGMRNRDYWQGLGERFGFGSALSGDTHSTWVQPEPARRHGLLPDQSTDAGLR